MPEFRRLSTGIPEVDKLVAGGIPEGFLVAITGEPGTGKTVFCMHFIAQGLRECDKCVYVTTEESRESILRQAEQFDLGFREGLEAGKLIIIDALTGTEDRWSLKSLDVEALVDKVIEAKKELGRGRGRLVIDSMSAFWLDKPAMARKYSY
ncbi:KaiC domain-containing protein, partial [Candidatus Bathyarchaeota archaeon]